VGGGVKRIDQGAFDEAPARGADDGERTRLSQKLDKISTKESAGAESSKWDSDKGPDTRRWRL